MRLIGNSVRTRAHIMMRDLGDRTLYWGDADSCVKAWASEMVLVSISVTNVLLCAALGHAPIAGTCILCGKDI